MRLLAATGIATAFVVLAWPLAAHAAPSTSDGGHVVKSEQQKKADAEAAARDKRIKQTWSRVFAPPRAHRWEFGVGAGSIFADTAYGDSVPHWYWGVDARRLFREYLAAGLTVDFWQDTPSAGPLNFASREVGMLGALGFHHWFGRWLLGADARAGIQWLSYSIVDETGTVASGNHVDPALGAMSRAGVSLAGTLSLSVEGGLRWHPGRVDSIVLVQLGWIAGP